MAKTKLLNIIEEQKIEFVNENYDILFFLTGGSEAEAIKNVNVNKFYTLIASKENHSYAAANEVKAYFDQKKINSTLLSLDENECKQFIDDYYKVKLALSNIRGQNLGLIGEVSDWLVASSIDADLLKEKLGINLKQILWNSLPDYKTMEVSKKFNESFNGNKKIDINDTSKVYVLLKNLIAKEKLNAITVECFSLVRKNNTTACLPLSKLNDEGIPAGCEGDITSIVGMIIAKEITGITPWMANIIRVSNDVSIFAHCTIASNLITNYTLTTHFETGVGLAIQGDFESNDITIFRFNNKLDKAFITTGKVTNRPKYNFACRTQIEVQLPQDAVKELKERPLGNHHLIIPGTHKHKIELVCKLLNIKYNS